MKLYGTPTSTACRPVLMFAADHHLPLDLEPVDLFAGEHLGEAYTALNPNQAVPLLIDGDLVLPADGRPLLAALDAALDGLAAADTPAVRAALARFVDQLQVLMETGLLQPGDAHLRMDAAAAVLTSLRG